MKPYKKDIVPACKISFLSRAGLNQSQIARKCGVSRQAIHSRIRGRYMQKRKFKGTVKERHNEIARMCCEGRSRKYIAKRFGYQEDTVYVIIRKLIKEGKLSVRSKFYIP